MRQILCDHTGWIGEGELRLRKGDAVPGYLPARSVTSAISIRSCAIHSAVLSITVTRAWPSDDRRVLARLLNGPVALFTCYSVRHCKISPARGPQSLEAHRGPRVASDRLGCSRHLRRRSR